MFNLVYSRFDDDLGRTELPSIDDNDVELYLRLGDFFFVYFFAVASDLGLQNRRISNSAAWKIGTPIEDSASRMERRN